MFVGEFIIRRGRCVMCDMYKKRYVMEFSSSRDEDGLIEVNYELISTDTVDQSVCSSCWRKLGRYILSRWNYQKRPPVRMLQLAELLKAAPKQSLPTYQIAQKIYGANDPTSLDKVMKLIKRLKLNGYDISHSWGGSYTLVSEPEIPLDYDED